MRDILAYYGKPTALPRIAPARCLPVWDLPAGGAGCGDPHAELATEYEFDQRIA